MLFVHGRDHVNPCNNLLGILKFENIYGLEVSLFTHKVKNNKSDSPAVLLNIFTPPSEIHSRNTRYATNQNFFIHQYAVLMVHVYLHLNLSTAKIWESVPLELNRFPYNACQKVV